MLLIHGAACTETVWHRVAPLLPGARAIALPGHVHGSALNSVEAYADWLIGRVAVPSILVGYAMGGSIALEAALRAPERVVALVVVNSGARVRVSPDLFRRLEADSTEGVKFIWTNAAGRLSDPEVIATMIDASLQLDRKTVTADFEVVNRWDALNRVSGIRVPTLVVAGSDDRFTPPKYAEYVASQVPNAALRIIEGAGHIVPLEAPAELADEILRFIDNVRARIDV